MCYSETEICRDYFYTMTTECRLTFYMPAPSYRLFYKQLLDYLFNSQFIEKVLLDRSLDH